jgi:hypothetical protein
VIRTLALAVLLSSVGCAQFAEYAPQTAKPSPAPVAPASVELIINGSRPACAYQVIGSVFANVTEGGLETLRQRAALEGATGVYDIECKDASRTLVGGHTDVRTGCSGRVYVCPAGGA